MATVEHEKTFIGARLKDERERLNLGQEEMAVRLGVKRNTQGQYERGGSAPDAAYLAQAAALGVDVLYVVTGVRAGRGSVTAEQSRLLDAFAATQGERRAAALVVAEALAGLPARPAPAAGAAGGMTEAELWRAVARALPSTPGADTSAQLTVQQWLDIVDGAVARESGRRLPRNPNASLDHDHDHDHDQDQDDRPRQRA